MVSGSGVKSSPGCRRSPEVKPWSWNRGMEGGELRPVRPAGSGMAENSPQTRIFEETWHKSRRENQLCEGEFDCLERSGRVRLGKLEWSRFSPDEGREN